MPAVEYTNIEGYKSIRLVPEGATKSTYYMGLLIGPPDLSDIPITKEERIALNNSLVDHSLLRYPDISGRRGLLIELAKEHVTSIPASEVRDWMVRAYQKQEYPDLFGGN